MEHKVEIAQIVDEFISLCHVGQLIDAIDRFYGDDVVVVEPIGDTGTIRTTQGKHAVRVNNERWLRENSIHSLKVGAPMLGLSSFAVPFDFDLTHLPSGHRKRLSEVGIYQLLDRTIVKATFYYGAA